MRRRKILFTLRRKKEKKEKKKINNPKRILVVKTTYAPAGGKRGEDGASPHVDCALRFMQAGRQAGKQGKQHMEENLFGALFLYHTLSSRDRRAAPLRLCRTAAFN